MKLSAVLACLGIVLATAALLALISCLLWSFRAHGDTLINTASVAWAWDAPTDGAAGPYYQIERNTGEQSAFQARTVSLPPPDRDALAPLSIRVRTCIDAFNCGPWSQWSDPVRGVPLGYDADTDMDGMLDPADFDLFFRIFTQGHTWPR